MSEDRPVPVQSAGTMPAGDPADAGSDPQAAVPDGGIRRRLQEYVTFGQGLDHLLEVVLLQFGVLFLDIELLTYTIEGIPSGRQRFRTVVWSLAVLGFLVLLTILVRRMGRRTLAPRFHHPRNVLRSVAGYVLASGVSFCLGYVTLVVPTRTDETLQAPELLPAALLVTVFATFIAVGYHRQFDAAKHPEYVEVEATISAWLAAQSWVDEPPNSMARQRTHGEFLERSDEVVAVLSEARTVEGSRLAADFAAWRDAFLAHSMLSREMVVRGSLDDGALRSDRVAAEHREFLELRDRLEAVAEVSD